MFKSRKRHQIINKIQKFIVALSTPQNGQMLLGNNLPKTNSLSINRLRRDQINITLDEGLVESPKQKQSPKQH